MCRAEFRRLKPIYPDFANDLNFFALGVDPLESREMLRAYASSQEFPWPAGQAGPDFVRTFNVTSTSVKVAMDRNLTIVMRSGYGVEPADGWQALFKRLVET